MKTSKLERGFPQRPQFPTSKRLKRSRFRMPRPIYTKPMTDDDKLIDAQGNVDEDELDRRIRELGIDGDSDGADTLSEQVQAAREKNARLDDEFAGRLNALEERARQQKLLRDNQKREENRKMESSRQSARGLGVGLSIAYTLIGLPLIGVAIGWFLDSRTGGTAYKGIGAVAGTVLGIVMTVLLLSRADRQK